MSRDFSTWFSRQSTEEQARIEALLAREERERNEPPAVADWTDVTKYPGGYGLDLETHWPRQAEHLANMREERRKVARYAGWAHLLTEWFPE